MLSRTFYLCATLSLILKWSSHLFFWFEHFSLSSLQWNLYPCAQNKVQYSCKIDRQFELFVCQKARDREKDAKFEHLKKKSGHWKTDRGQKLPPSFILFFISLFSNEFILLFVMILIFSLFFAMNQTWSIRLINASIVRTLWTLV